MQKNDYLLAKFGVDTAENEPLRARLRARLNIGAGCHGRDVGAEVRGADAEGRRGGHVGCRRLWHLS